MKTEPVSALVPVLDIDKVLHPHGMPPRCRLERRIVANLLAHLMRAGFYCAMLDDGDQDVAIPLAGLNLATIKEVMELVFNLDDCRLYFKHKTSPNRNWVSLVLGNGVDLLSDYGTRGPTDPWDVALESFDAEQWA